jgi:hypothetical protein
LDDLLPCPLPFPLLVTDLSTAPPVLTAATGLGVSLARLHVPPGPCEPPTPSVVRGRGWCGQVVYPHGDGYRGWRRDQGRLPDSPWNPPMHSSLHSSAFPRQDPTVSCIAVRYRE